MVAGPFEGEPERTRRKPTVDQVERLDRDLRGMIPVARVEVRRRVVAEYIVITMP
jgi:hypothetical protein